MSLRTPPTGVHTAEYTTEPTGPPRSLVAMRCRNASASGPSTTARVSEVRSKIATRSRAARCSVATLGRPELCRPAGPGRGRIAAGSVSNHWARSKPLPSKKIRAELLQPIVERRDPQRPGDAQRLERVDQVVDLVVVAGPAGAHVRARGLDGLEAIEVQLVGVEAGVAVGDPVGHDPTDAAAVGQPHRLGDPGAAHRARLAHDREAVGREREHAVERVVDGAPSRARA